MTQITGCGTWQLDTTLTTPEFSLAEISCSEERSPLCIRPIDSAQPITTVFSNSSIINPIRKNKGKGRRRNQVNKKRQSLRWKQRKNKKAGKVGFTNRRQARQTGQGCDPIEVSFSNIFRSMSISLSLSPLLHHYCNHDYTNNYNPLTALLLARQ